MREKYTNTIFGGWMAGCLVGIYGDLSPGGFHSTSLIMIISKWTPFPNCRVFFSKFFLSGILCFFATTSTAIRYYSVADITPDDNEEDANTTKQSIISSSPASL